MLRWSNILMVASLGLASLVSALNSYLEVAPNQGCVLLAGFDVTSKDAGSLAELRVEVKSASTICGFGSNLLNDGRYHKAKIATSNQGWIWVAYGGMVPFNSNTTQFRDFPICVIGPDELFADGTKVKARPGQANIDLSGGSYLWFSSDALYNATIPAGQDPVSFPKIRECHARGDKVHLDSAIFANHEQILDQLPNPYSSYIQSSESINDSTWPAKAVTIQLATATAASGLVAKRTNVPRIG